MARRKLIPDISRLRECLSYDPETGILRWRMQMSQKCAGDIAGYKDHRGYLYIRLDRKLVLAHRVAWALHHGVWPDGDLDHKNRDKSDNSLTNLRLATRVQNNANSARSKLPKGCYRLKGRRQWYSQIKVNGAVKRLGTFATVADAAAAFEREHRAIHGAFSLCEAR